MVRAASLRGISARGCPSRRILPFAGGRSPASSLRRVDFPEPFSPSTATTSPPSRSSVIEPSASRSPYETDTPSSAYRRRAPKELLRTGASSGRETPERRRER